MERPEKFVFNIKMLSLAFDIDRTTVTNMIQGVKPIGKKGRSLLYDIKDVATLKETRDSMLVEKFTNNKYKDKPHHSNSTTDPDNSDGLITDPEQMTPVQRINYYKAEDLRQSAQLKQHKNDVESGKLMIALDVERTVAEAFKKIALVMDTLPDLLERDGIIGSSDIERVIDVLDKSREQLAIDLSEISPMTEDINYKGDW